MVLFFKSRHCKKNAIKNFRGKGKVSREAAEKCFSFSYNLLAAQKYKSCLSAQQDSVVRQTVPAASWCGVVLTERRALGPWDPLVQGFSSLQGLTVGTFRKPLLCSALPTLKPGPLGCVEELWESVQARCYLCEDQAVR